MISKKLGKRSKLWNNNNSMKDYTCTKKGYIHLFPANIIGSNLLYTQNICACATKSGPRLVSIHIRVSRTLLQLSTMVRMGNEA
jgi:hypothetical protein